MIQSERLMEIVDRFPRCHLLVIGDLILDRFIWGEVERISPEAPVPVLRVTSESFRLGGAANVVHNILTLGGRASVCGVVGRDAAGKRLLEDLLKIGASADGVFPADHFHTTQKTRVIARPRHQQIVRLDRENRNEIARGALDKLNLFLKKRARGCHGLVLSDYGKGVIHEALLAQASALATNQNLFCVIDPKKENFHRYRRVTLLTPNKDEASEASGIAIRDEKSLRQAGQKLLRMWQAEAVLITRGSDGVSLFRSNRPVKHFPTEPRHLFEVTGAGDTVVAACSLALASGATYEEAAVIANLAAGFVGDEIGTVAVPMEKLKTAIKDRK